MKPQIIILLIVLLLMNGCGINIPINEEPITVIMVKPEDPVWLVNDLENIEVLVLNSNGEFKKGVVKRIHAGSIIWYDHNK